ncbi:uncharacterized protein DNG_09146 [Cephalotrichum gorgonifer]|uniref:Nucleoside phosphorylase domain-containing protein n=1 Tax=Cephalotrichum gorgonifer TaxID=2041049 RepID=A0AAE8N543_9PEZI|nr:uncharacterized protein DNG_09146 [Cephalotrichum gorgonifer]
MEEERRREAEWKRSETQSEVLDEPTSRDDFTIGIICALPLEAGAILRVFDRTWSVTRSGKRKGDTNQYSLGSLGPHNVVLVHIPKDVEPFEAAAMATACRKSFPNIDLLVVVGACGGAPTSTGTDEILLGDVVISTNIVEYENITYGTNGAGDSEDQSDPSLKISIIDDRQPHPEIRNLLSKLEVEEYREALQDGMAEILSRLPTNKAPYPLALEDRCFEAGYIHKHNDGSTCAMCIDEKGGRVCEQVSRFSCVELSCTRDRHIVRGRSSGENKPAVHLGTIAIGEEVPRSGIERDRATIEAGAMAFDTGLAACVSDSFDRVLVIRGIFHYSDGHRHEMEAWQKYASATAASCAKVVLEEHWVREDEELENFSPGDFGADLGS